MDRKVQYPAMTSEEQYRKWRWKAPLGLVLTGFGASLLGEATVYKHSGAATGKWVGFGTLALVVFNSGLSILADAAKHRAHYERLQDQAAAVNNTLHAV